MPVLENLVNASGQRTNADLPGINQVKRNRINTYVNGLIGTHALDKKNVHTLIKDNGTDIVITVFNGKSIHTQINFSQI